ncbi:MAG: NAD-dependent epimerase/dehydratase family protein [Thermoleophilia bacterium]|nr:NAD-dependent epimerase/dehydratase family protein [Thermoleophilia bacterium]
MLRGMGTERRSPGSFGHLLRQQGVRFEPALTDMDSVMHLAGYIEVAESQAHPGRYFQNNVAAPLVMLEAMVRQGVQGRCSRPPRRPTESRWPYPSRKTRAFFP